MAVNPSSNQQAMSEINVTPLVDVMLVLLVIFIVAAPLLIQSVQVKLPKTSATSPVTKSGQIVLSIDKHGEYYIDQRRVNVDALEQALVRRKTAGASSVQIDADHAVPYGRVARVLAIINRAGISKLAFASVLR
jgi:biopolymer transport protein TolR